MHYTDSRDYDYSFAIVGDTQYTIKFDAATDYAYDTKTEWDVAYNQISRLNGIIPYSLVRGNHDNPTYFDKYFADSVADGGIGNSFYMSQFSDVDPKMGMVAMLYFSNGGKEVRIEYISTIRTLLSQDGKDVYFAPEKNSYSFKFRDIDEGEWDLITPANITPDGQASFKGTYYGAKPITLTLIAASYVGDSLYDIDFSEEKNVSSISEVELSANVETTEGATVKYFLWESLSTVKPYVSDTAQ